jgi:hypothetical protein
MRTPNRSDRLCVEIVLRLEAGRRYRQALSVIEPERAGHGADCHSNNNSQVLPCYL